MTVQIVNVPPEIQAAIDADELTKIKITEGRMRLKNGIFTLDVKDLLPAEAGKIEGKSKSKSNAERQRALAERRKKAGLVRGWIHKSVLELAEDLGGSEEIAVEIGRLRVRLAEAEEFIALESHVNRRANTSASRTT